MKKRYLQENIEADLQEKMVFLSGPRQVGKTTLARTFLKTQDDVYYNWDRREGRREALSSQAVSRFWKDSRGISGPPLS